MNTFNLYTFFTKRYDRKEYLRRLLGEFAHENRDVLLIVADPKSDYLFCAYRDRTVLGQIKSLDGTKMNVVKNLLSEESALNEKRFNKYIGYFTASLIDVLKVSVHKGNQFYSFLDGSIFNIVKVIFAPQPKVVNQIKAPDNNVKN